MNQKACSQDLYLFGLAIVLNSMMSSFVMNRTLLIIAHGDPAFRDLAASSSITLKVVAGLLALIAGILILTRRDYRRYGKLIATLLVIQLICIAVVLVSILDMWVLVGAASLELLVVTTLVQVVRTFSH